MVFQIQIHTLGNPPVISINHTRGLVVDAVVGLNSSILNQELNSGTQLGRGKTRGVGAASAPPPPSKKAPPGGLEPPTHGLEERGQILVGLHGPCLGLCGPALALWGLWALMGLCARNVARGGELSAVGVRGRRPGPHRRSPSTRWLHCS